MELGFIIVVAVAVGLPLSLISVVEVYKRHVSFKERQLELLANRGAEKAAQYAAQVEKLEDRMRVLERIATDKGVDLALQIEELRDAPKAAPQAAIEELAR